MLNVYKKYDNPEELAGYNEKYPLLTAFDKLTKKGLLNQSDIDLLNVNKDIIKRYPKIAYYYARDIIKGRWEEAEPYIMKSPEWGYDYATYIIKGRWEDAEPYIMTDPANAYAYAENILGNDPKWTNAPGHENGRWPEAEQYIIKEPEIAALYAVDVMKKRWRDIEKTISRDNFAWVQYADYFEIN